jgi:3'(2'), 5'-bisphosphate nucleotidase
MPYASERQLALHAVAQAARICRAVQSEITPDVLAKKDKSPVTVADFGSQALIGKILADAFPHDPLVAEEDAAELRLAENERLLGSVVSHVRAIEGHAETQAVLRSIDHGTAQSHARRFWTLDPIDGTKGFLRREQYAIALALIVEGRVTVAALACPNLPLDAGNPDHVGAVFLAVRGQGTALGSLDDPKRPERAVKVSSTSSTDQARFCESVESAHSAHDDSQRIAELLNMSADPVRMDSQAKYGVVARGQADLYLRLPTRADYREKIWDHAAGALVIEEAGGMVTDIDGKPLDFTHGREFSANRGIIASNGILHKAALAAIASLGI